METLSPAPGNTLDVDTFTSYLENELLSSEDEGDRDNEDC
jgi:hypothetical protein